MGSIMGQNEAHSTFSWCPLDFQVGLLIHYGEREWASLWIALRPIVLFTRSGMNHIAIAQAQAHMVNKLQLTFVGLWACNSG